MQCCPWMGKTLALTLVLAALPLAVFSQQPGTASFKLKVPTDAKVIVNGVATKTPGVERNYVTPPIPAGVTQTYVVDVIYLENGQERKITFRLPLRAGENIALDLGGPGASTKTPDPAKKEETKKVDPKKVDPPKKDDPKKDEPKKVEPKKEEPKKVDPPKKEEPKKDEPKKDEPKKVDPKKVDPKKDEPKKVESPKTSGAKERSFFFKYNGVVTGQTPGKEVKVWLPVAQNSPEQTVTIADKNLPGPDKVGTEPLYKNKVLSFTAKADAKGEVPFAVNYKVTRKEVQTDYKGNLVLKPREDKKLLDRFLAPDQLVPTTGKPLELIQDKKLPGDQFAAAKMLYDVVNNHMKYSKEGTGWGKGDSVWACDSKFGNCTDFHSLFISMARGNKIPSKFEMGFPIPEQRGDGVVGGYHCWAWFLPEGKGWIPVDISEANRFPNMKDYYFGNLTENRVVFTTGRDITLVPAQKGPPLNFFIYPYAEVDGQPVPLEKIQRSFSYQDVKGIN